MPLTEKFARKQLKRLMPVAENGSLAAARRSQEIVGAILAAIKRKGCFEEKARLPLCEAAWIDPKKRTKDGAILYLHGGGYTCGGLEYAKGFASVLAAECGVRVFCPAYRLAPEYKFPAALDDARDAYTYLLNVGYAAENIVLCGESAGGGLIYSLCLKLKSEGAALPAASVAISPWTDLTQSGASYEYNKENDPSMSKRRLDHFADCYASDKRDPLVSPAFGDLHGMPPSLVFSGGDEVMLDDALSFCEKLKECGCEYTHIITPGMWHAYPLYCLKEHTDDIKRIDAFFRKYLPYV